MMKNTCQKKLKRKQGGFTLLELLVALAILALLATLVGPRVIGYLGTSKSKAALVQIKNIQASIDLYLLDNGHYPKSLNSLIKNSENTDGWAGPYLKSENGLVDPWGRKFIYKAPGKESDYEISTLGADNSEGGEGENQDIKSP